MFTLPTRRKRPQRGFTLIEIMIGAAIALIGMVVIFQVLTVWEARKRTTSAGSDAQVSGAIAMYSLARDLKQGGYGFGGSPALGCSISGYDTTLGAAITGTPAQPVFRLAPVEIVDGAGGAPDEIRVLYGNSSNFTANQSFDLSPTPTSKRISSNGSRAGFHIGDLLLISGNSPITCDLVEITGLPTTLGETSYIEHGANSTSRFSNPAGTAATYTNGTLNDLGPDPQWDIWQVRPVAGGTAPRELAWSDFIHSPNTWTEVAEGIVDMQAQYGYDDDGDHKIECPNTAATPVCEWQSALTSPPLTAPITWSKVLAIRVALLARSQQYEETAVYTPPGCTGSSCTPPAPSWAGGWFTMRNVDGTADNAPDDTNDWRHYRYEVFQQVVSLRNMIWDNSP